LSNVVGACIVNFCLQLELTNKWKQLAAHIGLQTYSIGVLVFSFPCQQPLLCRNKHHK